MASSFTLAAFTYETPNMDHDQLVYDQGSNSDFEILAQEKPEEEKQEAEEVPEKQEDDAQDQDQSSDENQDLSKIKKTDNGKQKVKSKVKKPGGPTFTIKKIKNDDTIHDVVDVDAEFPGGYGAMKVFIGENYTIPEDARIMGEQGKVYVDFVVETDGSITNVEIAKSVFGSIDREAKRVVRSFPKWKPGEVDFLKVRTRVSLPIVVTFQ